MSGQGLAITMSALDQKRTFRTVGADGSSLNDRSWNG
jgi:hypothetical protein